MNKPVAIRYDFDGYGYQYIDSGSGSDWQTRVKGEPLYTHPVKVNYECNSSEQNKPIVYWDGKHFASKDKSSLADIPLYTHPAELTEDGGKVCARCGAIAYDPVIPQRNAQARCNGFCGEYECKENKENCLRTKAATNKECNPMGMNKPVAWMGTIHGVKTYFKSVDGIDFEGMIPLYTTPQIKELSDEEILEVWRENERVYPMDRSRLLDRTRACIKKASEK